MHKFLIVFLVLSLGACMSMGTKVDADKLSNFKKGQTTYDQVVEQLGPPTQSTVNSDGVRTATYTYVHSQASAATFIPVVGAFMGGASTENSTVMLTFDKNSRLLSYSSSQGGSSMGNGLVSGAKQ